MLTFYAKWRIEVKTDTYICMWIPLHEANWDIWNQSPGLVLQDTVLTYMYIFTAQFMRAIAMKQKAMLSLWHWSQCLQRKVSS